MYMVTRKQTRVQNVPFTQHLTIDLLVRYDLVTDGQSSGWPFRSIPCFSVQTSSHAVPNNFSLCVCTVVHVDDVITLQRTVTTQYLRTSDRTRDCFMTYHCSLACLRLFLSFRRLELTTKNGNGE